MQRILEYMLFFAVLFLLQVFLFDNLSIWTYLAPLPYVALFVMLPLNIPHGWLILTGFCAGVILDFFTGTGGLHTIASTFTCFVRPVTVNITMGKDFWRDSGGTLSHREIKSWKWLRYAAVLTLLHCTVYFLFEALTWQYLIHTALKIAASSVVTILLVWFTGLIYPLRR